MGSSGDKKTSIGGKLGVFDGAVFSVQRWGYVRKAQAENRSLLGVIFFLGADGFFPVSDNFKKK